MPPAPPPDRPRPPRARRVGRTLARPLRVFLATEAAGGIVLLAATVAALVWANSPLAASYGSVWDTTFGFELGAIDLRMDLHHWINDGLMTLFFFVVGLEIKRELVTGELNDARKAVIPVVAAIGGMVVPALVFVVFNAGGAGAAGWGIPMATDIAFAMGVLALLSERIPAGLKIFLLSLAIVDDIGAILVIALFYSSGIGFGWLAVAVSLLTAIVVLGRRGVAAIPIYVVLGVAVWLATLQSGVHATIAGAILGLLTPARTRPGEEMSVAERLEGLLHPWTSFLVVPLFALANAGVALSLDGIADALASSISIGVALGLVVGKTAGISAATWLAVRTGLGRLPDEVRWRHIFGAATVAGIGFTVSLFITALAFDERALIAEAKIGVLLGSFVAGLAGAAILATGSKR